MVAAGYGCETCNWQTQPARLRTHATANARLTNANGVQVVPDCPALLSPSSQRHHRTTPWCPSRHSAGYVHEVPNHVEPSKSVTVQYIKVTTSTSSGCPAMSLLQNCCEPTQMTEAACQHCCALLPKTDESSNSVLAARSQACQWGTLVHMYRHAYMHTCADTFAYTKHSSCSECIQWPTVRYRSE